MENNRSRNMFTGLGVVVFIMLFIIAMPFMMGLASFIMSAVITVAMIGIGLWLIIVLLSAVGGMFNSARDKKVGTYAKARVKDGRNAWNSGIDSFSKILSRMKTKAEDDPNVIYQGHDEGDAAQQEHADAHYAEQEQAQPQS